jgi:hypothetical protein
MATKYPYAKKPFVSSIPLWMRTDQPRQTGMDYWKGPHSKIISATPGFEEYRQIHLAEHNPGLWPATRGVETAIPDERRIDGVAEVTFGSVLSTLLGRKQTRLAFQDEVNVFRRTLLYVGPPNSARWYDVRRARREGRCPSPALPEAKGRSPHRHFPQAHQRARPHARRHGRAEGTEDPGLHALEREALGHPERRARQPGRPAVPRIADLGLHGRAAAGGFFHGREIRACRTRWLGSLRPSTPTTCPRR